MLKFQPAARELQPLIFVILNFLCFLTACTDRSALQQKFARAVDEYNRGELETALVLFQEVDAADPALTGAGIMIGRIHYYKERYEQAEEVLSTAIESNPARLEALLWRARVRRQTGRFALALADLERLTALDTTGVQSWALLGQVYADLDRVPDAIAAYRLALRNGEKLDEAREGLAEIYEKSGLPERAAKVRAGAGGEL